MMKKIKEFMASPYTRGDYYGAIGVMIAIYAVLVAGCVAYTKITEMKEKKSKAQLPRETIYEDEEA